MQRLTASSADHFFSKSTEEERHVEGDFNLYSKQKKIQSKSNSNII